MPAWPDVLNAYQFFLGARVTGGSAGNVAVRFGDQSFTYAEIDRMTDGFAARLAGAGVAKGQRVLMLMNDSPSFVACLFGTFKIGAVAVMLNPTLKAEALGPVVELSEAPVAVVDNRYLDHFTTSLSDWRPAIVDPDSVPPDDSVPVISTSPDDPALWLFSGGTTGVPKAVPQTHKSLVNTTRLYGQGLLGLTEDDITIAVPKLYFGYATGSNLLFPFSVGASSVLFDDHPTPEVVFAEIERHRPTVLVNVPSAINQMLSHPDANEADMTSLRVSTSAGEALPETLYHRWVETFGVELLDGLGTAEMWHIFVSNRLGDVRPGTLGRVVDGFEIKACDDSGEEVARGEVGRLWVKGDSLGLGYVDDVEKTKDAFRDGWFVGGDLVSIDDDGYVTHRGRSDDAVKVKGKWFRPQEVESVLLDHANVAECAVIAVDDADGLSKPVAFVVPDGDVAPQALIEWVLDHLEAYKHPREVIIVEKLPLTHLGKTDRGALRRLVRN